MLFDDEVSLERLRSNLCPNCGFGANRHSGLGGSNCSLTDLGVAQLIYEQQKKDQADGALE